MKCPKCEQDLLEPTTVHGIELDRCRHCHGLWLDEEELPTLLERSPGDAKKLSGKRVDEIANEKPGYCPRDQSKLLRAYSARNKNIILDTCPECRGIWLDAGELAKLV